MIRTASTKEYAGKSIVFKVKGPYLIGRYIIACLLLTAMGVTQSTTAKEASAHSAVVGNWSGILKVSPGGLRIVFKIKKKDGVLSASMASPDQSANSIPVSKVIFKNNALTIESAAIGGVYNGKLKDKKVLVGTWTQGGRTFPLDLKKGKPARLKRPQTPKGPFPYTVEQVEYMNTKDNFKLGGTLTLPKSTGPFPAVLLLSGSGAQDRDSTIFEHKPFWVLADHLTRNGIAVLRVDDRGIGKSGKNLAMSKLLKSTTADFADDAKAGIDFLKRRKDIDPKRIGMIGHSEGGIIAFMVAAQRDDIAYVVSMAGTGLVGEKVLLLQNGKIMDVAGTDSAQKKKAQETNARLYTIAISDQAPAAKAEKLKKVLLEDAPASGPARRTAEKDADAVVKKLLLPWMVFFLKHDPGQDLVKVKCPVLAIIGELDVQALPKENLVAIEAALKSGGNNDVTVKELPKLNHLFQTAKTGAVTEYRTIEETISPVALNLITEWLREKTKKTSDQGEVEKSVK